MGRDSGKSVERKWYCHACGDGPLNYKLVLICPMCDHYRCEYCHVDKTRHPPRH